MISMTGFGRGSAAALGRTLVVEARSVNHRHFDLKIRLPGSDGAAESRLRDLVRAGIERGAVMVSVDVQAAPAAQVQVDVERAKAYHASLARLQAELGLVGEVPLSLLATLPGVLDGRDDEAERALQEALWPAAEAALDGLVQMRRREGKALEAELRGRIATLRTLAAELARLAAAVPLEARDRMHERLGRLLDGGEVDPQRLAQEVALLADRLDVSEELSRLRMHMEAFEALCGAPGAVGRRLEFLLQEMGREINTTGAKAQSGPMTRLVVEAKAELEKMREQVQNVE